MTNAALFNTVSTRDGLNFWQGSALNFQKVRDFRASMSLTSLA